VIFLNCTLQGWWPVRLQLDIYWKYYMKLFDYRLLGWCAIFIVISLALSIFSLKGVLSLLHDWGFTLTLHNFWHLFLLFYREEMLLTTPCWAINSCCTLKFHWHESKLDHNIISFFLSHFSYRRFVFSDLFISIEWGLRLLFAFCKLSQQLEHYIWPVTIFKTMFLNCILLKEEMQVDCIAFPQTSIISHW
jgi:hypothetical protein